MLFKSSHEHTCLSLQGMQYPRTTPQQGILGAQSMGGGLSTGLPSTLNQRSQIPLGNLSHVPSQTTHQIQNAQPQQQQSHQPPNTNPSLRDPSDIPVRTPGRESPLLRNFLQDHHASPTPPHTTNPLLRPHASSSPPVGSSEPISIKTADVESVRKEMEQFVESFKQRRKELGYSQKDASLALGKLNGMDISQRTVAQFEVHSYSIDTMCKLKPFLLEWLNYEENNITNRQILTNSGQRKVLTPSETATLEREFNRNPLPNSEEIAKLSNLISKDKERVREWFKKRLVH